MRILNAAQVEELLDMNKALEAVRQAFIAHGEGRVVMPPKVFVPLPGGLDDFRAMPAFLPGTEGLEGTAGVKWVNTHPQNPSEHQLPAVMGSIILSDPETAMPLCLMNATALTAVRTGCAAALASECLAPPAVEGKPRTLGLLGCGAQGRSAALAHLALLGPFDILCSDINAETAQALADDVQGRVSTDREASGCQIVCTATPSARVIVEREWVGQATHINAVGADAFHKHELAPAIIQESKLVVDDMDQALVMGEIAEMLHDHLLAPTQIFGTLGELLCGKKGGRTDDEITVFDSTGLAIQDLAVARMIYDEAERRDVGTIVDF